MTEAAALALRLRRRGVWLWLESGRVRYRALKGVLEDDDRRALRASRDELCSFLVAEARAAAHLRAVPVVVLIGRLAAAGIWFRVVGDRAEVRVHDDADLGVLDDEALIEALGTREAEVIAFLRRPAEYLTPAERVALGYTPTGPIALAVAPSEEAP